MLGSLADSQAARISASASTFVKKARNRIRKRLARPPWAALLILISIVVPTLLWTDLRNPYVWIALFALVGFGAIGFFDDYTKIKKKRNLGLDGAAEILGAGSGCAAGRLPPPALHAKRHVRHADQRAVFQTIQARSSDRSFAAQSLTYPLAFVFFFGFLFFMIVGSSNAVNLTDGLDGLAIGLMIIAAGAMTMLTYVSGHAVFRQLSGYRAPSAARRN